ncbi:15966_t:CDS:2 [Cetraspora pellucida]|uniref:15966_t:CDS:1 n=1 Tax=Cetraspora pellucida TaxID=1433469 RepID=A0A9N9FMT4_9GLOM|nr:15966_t:CDS:2 [Cetraspora pellucida]
MSHPSLIEKHESTNEDFYIPGKKDNLNHSSFYSHNIYEHVFNGNVGAPVHEKLENEAKVLEFGCESGIWSTEVAAEYPNSEFYAIDSENTLPNSIDNITFIHCDTLKEMSFPDNEFDYIFARDKFVTMEKEAFQKVLSEIFRVLKPGDNRIQEPAFARFVNAWESWLKTHNIDYDIMANLENYLQETGKAESISHKIVKTRIGGDAFKEFMLEHIFFRNTKDYMAPFMDISFEEFDNLMNDIENELNTTKDSKKEECIF